MLIVEGIVLCFWLLIVCVVGIADGVINMAYLYEQDVQERVVKLGLISKEELAKKQKIGGIAMVVPMTILTLAMVYGLNGADNFRDAFLQMSFLLVFAGLFDRIFIDWYWVGKTRTWLIEGTEDLMPYIPKKVVIGRWLGTLIAYPALAAILALIMKVIGF